MAGTLFGWLGDIVGTHVFVNGVPKALRRRWNFLGGVTATDNPATESLDLTISAGALVTGPGGTVDVTGSGLAMSSSAGTDLSSVGTVVISAPTINMTTGVGGLNFAGTARQIGNVADPTDPQHVSTKAYVDGLVAGGVPANITNNVSITGPGAIGVVATTLGLNATGSAGVTNLGTRAAEQVNIATGNSAYAVVGDAGGAGTILQGLDAINGAGNDVPVDAGSWFFSATGEITTDAPSVKVNGVRADYDYVAKGNGTTLEAGRVNEVTGSAWTLPALSGVAMGEVVKVIHSLTAGTISRAGADTINAGNGHATDTTFTLSDQQSVVTFQKTDVTGTPEWRVGYERSANGGGGGSGSSITDGTATWVLAAGSLTTTGTVDATISGSNDVVVQGASETVVGHATTGNTAVRGPATTISGTTSVTESVGSATRTVTASGANRTETYAGSVSFVATLLTLACAIAHAATLTITGGTGLTFTATAGNIGLAASAGIVQLQSVAGYFQMAAARIFSFLDPSTGITRHAIWWAASTTPGANTATSVGTFTVQANRTTTLRGTWHARLSTGNWRSFNWALTVDANGTIATLGALNIVSTQLDTAGTPQGSGAGAPITTTDLAATVTGASLIVTINVTNANTMAVNVNGSADT